MFSFLFKDYIYLERPSLKHSDNYSTDSLMGYWSFSLDGYVYSVWGNVEDCSKLLLHQHSIRVIQLFCWHGIRSRKQQDSSALINHSHHYCVQTCHWEQPAWREIIRSFSPRMRSSLQSECSGTQRERKWEGARFARVINALKCLELDTDLKRMQDPYAPEEWGGDKGIGTGCKDDQFAEEVISC